MWQGGGGGCAPGGEGEGGRGEGGRRGTVTFSRHEGHTKTGLVSSAPETPGEICMDFSSNFFSKYTVFK